MQEWEYDIVAAVGGGAGASCGFGKVWMANWKLAATRVVEVEKCMVLRATAVEDIAGV